MHCVPPKHSPSKINAINSWKDGSNAPNQPKHENLSTHPFLSAEKPATRNLQRGDLQGGEGGGEVHEVVGLRLRLRLRLRLLVLLLSLLRAAAARSADAHGL
jgi:hypothetical protein